MVGALSTYAGADTIQSNKVQETNELLAEVDEIMSGDELRVESLAFQKSLLNSGEISQTFREGQLKVAEYELEQARDDLQTFKDDNNIVDNPFQNFSLQRAIGWHSGSSQ